MNAPISSNLNLTLQGMLATYENKSGSSTAAAAVALAGQLAKSWSSIYQYGERVRADQSRAPLDREALLAAFGKRTIDSVSPGVERSMLALTTRKADLQAKIDSTFKESDTLQAVQNQELRAHLRGLSDTARFEALADHVLAKAAAQGLPALSNLNIGRHEQIKQTVAMRERPQEMAEMADIGTATQALLMASDSLLKHTRSYTQAEVLANRVDAPDHQAAA